MAPNNLILTCVLGIVAVVAVSGQDYTGQWSRFPESDSRSPGLTSSQLFRTRSSGQFPTITSDQRPAQMMSALRFPQFQQAAGGGPRVLRISREEMLQMQREEAIKQRQRQQQQLGGQQRQQPGILANSRLTGSRTASSQRLPANVELARVDPSGRLIPLSASEKEEFLRRGGKIAGEVRPRSELSEGQRLPQGQRVQINPFPANQDAGFRDVRPLPSGQMTNSNKNMRNENNPIRMVTDEFVPRYSVANNPLRDNRRENEQKRQREERERLIQRERERDILHQKLIQQKKWDELQKLQRLQEDKVRQELLIEEQRLEQQKHFNQQQKHRQQEQTTSASAAVPQTTTASTEVPPIISAQEKTSIGKTDISSTTARKPVMSTTSPQIDNILVSLESMMTHPNDISTRLPLVSTDASNLMTSDSVLDLNKPTNQTAGIPTVPESATAKRERIYQLAELLGFKPSDLLKLVAEIEAKRQALDQLTTSQSPVMSTAQHSLPSTQVPVIHPSQDSITDRPIQVMDIVTDRSTKVSDNATGRPTKINVTFVLGLKNSATTERPTTQVYKTSQSLTNAANNQPIVTSTSNTPSQPSFSHQPTESDISTTATTLNSGHVTAGVTSPVNSGTEPTISVSVGTHEAKINELIKQMAVDMLISRIRQSKSINSSSEFDTQLANELVRLLGGRPIASPSTQGQPVVVDVSTVGLAETRQPHVDHTTPHVDHTTPQSVYDRSVSVNVVETSTTRGVETSSQNVPLTNISVPTGLEPAIQNATNQLASLAQTVIDSLTSQSASGNLRHDYPLVKAAQALLMQIKEISGKSPYIFNGTRTALTNMTLDLYTQTNSSTVDLSTSQSNASLNDTAIVGQELSNSTSFNNSLITDIYNYTSNSTIAAMENTTTAVPVTEATEAAPTAPPPPPGMPHLFEPLPGMDNDVVKWNTQTHPPGSHTNLPELISQPATSATSITAQEVDAKFSLMKSLARFYGVSLDEAESMVKMLESASKNKVISMTTTAVNKKLYDNVLEGRIVTEITSSPYTTVSSHDINSNVNLPELTTTQNTSDGYVTPTEAIPQNEGNKENKTAESAATSPMSPQQLVASSSLTNQSNIAKQPVEQVTESTGDLATEITKQIILKQNLLHSGIDSIQAVTEQSSIPTVTEISSIPTGMETASATVTRADNDTTVTRADNDTTVSDLNNPFGLDYMNSPDYTGAQPASETANRSVSNEIIQMATTIAGMYNLQVNEVVHMLLASKTSSNNLQISTETKNNGSQSTDMTAGLHDHNSPVDLFLTSAPTTLSTSRSDMTSVQSLSSSTLESSSDLNDPRSVSTTNLEPLEQHNQTVTTVSSAMTRMSSLLSSLSKLAMDIAAQKEKQHSIYVTSASGSHPEGNDMSTRSPMSPMSTTEADILSSVPQSSVISTLVSS